MDDNQKQFKEMVDALAREHGLRHFVETGTGSGQTCALVYPIFQKLHTIELLPKRWAEAHKLLEPFKGVYAHQGHSTNIIHLVADPGVPTLFWLDAYWFPGEEGFEKHRGKLPANPVINDLKKIRYNTYNSVILINQWKQFANEDPREPEDEWPCTRELTKLFDELLETSTFSIRNNIACIRPKG